MTEQPKMKLPYKLQQFWLRKGMWEWTFNAGQNLMFPHIYDKNECEEWENRFWFWEYLNNFDGDLENDFYFQRGPGRTNQKSNSKNVIL